MKAYRFSGAADLDLALIWEDIASDNVSAANKVTEAVLEACEMLARFPEAGKRKPTKRSPDLRVWYLAPYPNYVLAYRILPDAIHILRVLHSKRADAWSIL